MFTEWPFLRRRRPFGERPLFYFEWRSGSFSGEIFNLKMLTRGAVGVAPRAVLSSSASCVVKARALYYLNLCMVSSVSLLGCYFCSVHPSLSDGAAKVRPDVLSVIHPSASMVHVCVCTLSVLPVPGCSSAIDVTACLTLNENGELLPVISASQKSPMRATGQTSIVRPSLVKVATTYSLKG